MLNYTQSNARSATHKNVRATQFFHNVGYTYNMAACYYNDVTVPHRDARLVGWYIWGAESLSCTQWL